MAVSTTGKVKFELVSPEKILVSEEVDMVVVPGTEGNFGVLPGHAPFISSIRPGTIDIYAGREIAERIFVASGFAEVTNKRCTVLADEAVRVAALDHAQVEAELEQRKSELALVQGMADPARLRAAERAVTVATAKLQAVGRFADH
jgi:F-type H+-transporting ATPase subunit epsilon